MCHKLICVRVKSLAAEGKIAYNEGRHGGRVSALPMRRGGIFSRVKFMRPVRLVKGRIMFDQDSRITDLQIEQELQESYLTYAMSTIMDRALPDVRDGLKPSQRRILVAMNDLGLTPTKKPFKCAKIAGDTSGNYHP